MTSPPSPPPPTTVTNSYRAPPELVTWEPFTYAQPAVRRAAVRDYVGGVLEKGVKLPSLRLVLIGGWVPLSPLAPQPLSS